MSRFIGNRSKKIGLSPGSLVYLGKKKTEGVKITLMDYDKENINEKEIKKIEDCFPFKNTPTVTWINLDGVHDIKIIETIGKYYDIHSLILEDILNTDQRTKVEIFDSYIVLFFKMLTIDEKEIRINSEQVSLIIGPNYVISFQEKEGDIFEPVRQRIRIPDSKVRKMNTDYLAYSLLDIVIDNYFTILERIGEKIEILEEELVISPIPQTLKEIYRIKRELIFLRRCIWPMRDVISKLERADNSLIQEKTEIYLRDLYDHTIQVIDTVESFRDIIGGMQDLYLSSISNKLNDIMKVLTIIATIFIPLTFITGIYGMNFDYMPEIRWHWGYFAIWGLIITVAVSMLAYFKRKKWM